MFDHFPGVNRAMAITIGLLLSLATFVGCGSSSTVPMSGAVTLDDQSIRSGVLTLTPTERSAAPSTGATIAGGRYSIAADKGPKRGVTYRVEISSVDRTNLPAAAVAEDAIPPSYNRESTLIVTIPEDAKQFQHDFTLSSRAAKSN